MTVLELRFPAGRFHATPWGRHVNEGSVEWPPSPWRLLRALIATWRWKAMTDISEDTMRSLIVALSSSPRCFLPPATTGHTRHYMPIVEGKNEKTTKIFDTFIQLGESARVLMAWDWNLSPEQHGAFNLLAERLVYLGRSESLVTAALVESDVGVEFNAWPLSEEEPVPSGCELVRLLCPMDSVSYEQWRVGFTAEALAALGPKPSAQERKSLPDVPMDVFAALHADTGDLQSAGWNLPPGGHFVRFARPENCFASPIRTRQRRSGALPTVARFAITSSVMPSITDAVSVGDRIHAALCKWSDHGAGRAAVLTGVDEEGRRLSMEHAHAHIFCEATGSRDLITHITVWAEMGFDADACLALRQLRRVWGHGGHDIRVVLHGLGTPADFGGCDLFAASRKWRSVTPFVSTRHAKIYRDGRPKIDNTGWQIGSAPHDLHRLLQQHPHGAGASIRHLKESDLPYHFGQRRFRSLQFQTRRHGGNGSRGSDTGAAFEITFPEHRSGPFALGYGSHFGLGLFVPVAD